MPPETVEEPNYCFRRLERPLIPEFIQKDLSIFGNVVFVKRAALAAGLCFPQLSDAALILENAAAASA